MQRVCRPALKIPKRFTLPFHFGDVSLFSSQNAISQKIVHVSYGRDSHWTGKHRTIVHERLPSQVGVNFVNKLYQNCHNARGIQISFENHGLFPTQYGKKKLRRTFETENWFDHGQKWDHFKRMGIPVSHILIFWIQTVCTLRIQSFGFTFFQR